MYSSFNPGGLGHLDVKSAFVIPFREGKEARARFVPSTYRENPYLNREYIDYLEELPGALGKAWRDGDFDTFAGQYFSQWNYEKHVTEPFAIPETWRRYRMYDHGRTKPACCLWFAVDYDGNVWVYREYYPVGQDVDQIALEINRLSGNEQYEWSVADPAIFANTGMVDKYGGQTIGETFSRYGIMYMPASNRRVDGWNLLHQYLRWTPETAPKLRFFKNCTNAIRTIPSLIHDELHPEDLDSDGEDHAADSLRYGLVTLHEHKSEKPKSDIENKLAQLRQRDSIQSSLNNFYYGG